MINEELAYPLFVLALDDGSILEIANGGEFSGACEQIDVEDGLYEGWDSKGRHFRLVWDESRACPVTMFCERADGKTLVDAVHDYKRRVNALKKRPSRLVDPDYLERRLRELMERE